MNTHTHSTWTHAQISYYMITHTGSMNTSTHVTWTHMIHNVNTKTQEHMYLQTKPHMTSINPNTSPSGERGRLSSSGFCYTIVQKNLLFTCLVLIAWCGEVHFCFATRTGQQLTSEVKILRRLHAHPFLIQLKTAILIVVVVIEAE